MSLSTKAIVGIVGGGVTLPTTLVIVVRFYFNTIQPQLQSTVVNALAGLLQYGRRSSGSVTSETELLSQTQRLSKDGSLEEDMPVESCLREASHGQDALMVSIVPPNTRATKLNSYCGPRMRGFYSRICSSAVERLEMKM
ncbi:uncharacterized protein K489DRAFT_368339 [Dissoconium aciculare CBS 342.82]|uniref:Uncharacterized protein n=1 Tax=Dissoconium aciculare CBS 342.82 TaxID=1314786 RepID=A0A6J3MAU8_9PEZI|nr:uncharacterized protein K489DRAFT_368339 [Dissoconium aciculare CBS 342.82]KAF1825146.1 hypothetical protein K489DRAFT_368339 [Dissoconium aciculare CBS 342.82]